jgi:hypothetical protein
MCAGGYTIINSKVEPNNATGLMLKSSDHLHAHQLQNR